jgi:cobalt-zinc-cadmium efflux system membrane fusion protein
MEKYIISTLWIILAGAFLVSCSSANEESAESTPAPAEETVIQGISLSQEQIEMAGIAYGKPEMRKISNFIECTGKVEVPPNSLASVYSTIGGFVGNVKYLPGDYVKKGSLLTTIKHPDIIKMQTRYMEHKSRLEFAEKTYTRKQSLALEDAASQKSLEEAKVNFETERAMLKGLEAELKMIGLSTEQIDAGNIQPSINIYAPISGYIASVNINKGKLISPSDLLYEIVDDGHMHLELQIFAKDIPKVKKGQYIEAFVPGLDGKISASVYLVGHVIDLETKTTMVHGHFENKPTTLTAGTYLHARIFNEGNEILTIPESAVIRSGEESIVYVLKNGSFVKVPVQTGTSDGDFVAIEKLELSANEKLVTKGAYYIHGSDGEE